MVNEASCTGETSRCDDTTANPRMAGCVVNLPVAYSIVGLLVGGESGLLRSGVLDAVLFVP